MENKYTPIIGLEIHAELNTKTKMFCDSINDPEEKRPNHNVCPICLGYPGTLPVVNRQAVENVVKVGLALDGQIADFTEFDRKNYFYPDIPKGYQISQYKYPLVSKGGLLGVDITRVHLEEDTATSKHDRGDHTLIDFNRAGLPLMELVTEPQIKSAKQAGDFARELRLLLRYLGVSDANMEKGQMRIELNLSVSSDPKKFGTKVEVKNINSFKAVEQAAEYEISRQIGLLEDGQEVKQQTRGWDENKGQTFAQRDKEESHDYRYFPDPDIPKFYLSEIFDLEKLKNDLPELPNDKRKRFLKEFKIKEDDVEVFINDKSLANFFEDVATELQKDEEKCRLAANYIVSDVLGHMKKKENPKMPDSDLFAQLIQMIIDEKVSSRGAKNILEVMHESSQRPEEIAEEKGLLQISDEKKIEEMANKILETNPKQVSEYKSGKESLFQFFVGQMMKESKGQVNPKLAQDILKKLLNS